MNRIVLALVFLLATSSLVSAQNNQNKENLRGLTGVRLIVMFGRVEGLDEALRPEVLKMLEDGTRAKLEEAGIRLFRHAGETEPAGSPRLEVRVTLDKPNGFVYPLVSEVKLWQRVRLARDQAIETDAVTWSTDGVGFSSDGVNLPKLEIPMILPLVVGLIDRFIEDYRSVNPRQVASSVKQTPQPAPKN